MWMPRITVHAYATLGDILGSRNIEIITSANTLSTLIDFLAVNFDMSFKEMLIDPLTNSLQRSYRILINGIDVTSLNGVDTKIREGDTILFFPPVAGG